jgi:aspartate carbamoyltransferase catalytic subunit
MIKHTLSCDQFTPASLNSLFKKSEEFRKALADPKKRRELSGRHKDKQICCLFYEPSTRTRTSFVAAAHKLGFGVASTENAAEFSSAAKGETIEDTIRVINEYGFSAIIIRHPETGSAARAAAVSSAPIINGGDGKGEHPTQGLLDIYTIYREFGKLDHLNIVIGGDLKQGRTARSLAKMLAKYPGNHITFVSVPALQISQDIKDILRKSDTSFSETDSMSEAFKKADVVYWTRLQKERLGKGESFKSGGFVIDAKALKFLPPKAIIMHPLPRVDEINPEVDKDPRAKYFEQAGNGLYIRMALLDEAAS